MRAVLGLLAIVMWVIGWVGLFTQNDPMAKIGFSIAIVLSLVVIVMRVIDRKR